MFLENSFKTLLPVWCCQQHQEPEMCLLQGRHAQEAHKASQEKKNSFHDDKRVMKDRVWQQTGNDFFHK